VNPHARRGQEQLSEVIQRLRKLGLELIEEIAEEPQQLPGIIRRYQHQVDLVIVGGGDGTLNAAVEGLVATQLPLGILPLGTANDLARTLGIPTCLNKACKIIANGQIRRIDLGWVNGKYFFNVASLGLCVQITRKLTKAAKRRWGVWAYAATALRVLRQSQRFRAEIRLNGESIPVKTVQIAVGNGCYYGCGMKVVADAAIDDKLLDLYSLEIHHWWQILLLMLAIRRGRYNKRHGVRTLKGQEIEVHTHEPSAINTDGEITTYTPAKFRVMHKALAVLVPKP
jgi:YegS/Rv2252/BmrU family lipid kinase